MTIRRTIITAAAALAAAALLAGCSQGASSAAPTYGASASHGPTSTPTPTASVDYPTQKQVAPPKDQAAAYAAANKTIDGFIALQAQAYTHPEDGITRLQGYETGAALTNDEQGLTSYVKNGLYMSGTNATWEPDASTAAYGTAGTGSSAVKYGNVQVKGCFSFGDNAQVLAKPGHTAPSTFVPNLPLDFTVTYYPAGKVWYVSSQTNKVTGVSC